MKIIFLLITLLNFVFFNKVQGKECFKNLPFYSTDAEIEQLTQELINDQKNGNQIEQKCLEFLLERGFFKSATQLYENFKFNNSTAQAEQQKFNDEIRVLKSQIKRNLDQFDTSFHSSHIAPQKVEPAIQWAQSNSSIYINGKLGLRIDSPGCLTCRIVKADLQETYFNYTSFGIISHKPTLFNLYLEFEQPIDVEKSVYQDEAVVGAFIFEFVKKEEGIWKRPVTNFDKKIPVWWDMRDKYKKVMDEWEKIIEEEEYERKQKRKLERQEEKRKRKEEKEEKRKQKKQEKKNKKQTSAPSSWFDWAASYF